MLYINSRGTNTKAFYNEVTNILKLKIHHFLDIIINRPVTFISEDIILFYN